MNPSSDVPPRLTFLKLGGSLITDKDRRETPRLQVLARVAEEIGDALARGGDRGLLIGHGSGSFGHFAADAYGIHRGLGSEKDWRGLAETSAAAARLNRLVTDALLKSGVPALGLQPSASAHCRGGRLVSLSTEPIRQALKHGLVPLIYGDVAFDELQGTAIVSTEALLAYLAELFRPAWIVLAGDVAGVHLGDPGQVSGAAPIDRIRPEEVAELAGSLSASSKVDVTGGMLAKVRIMGELVSRRPEIRVLFVSGLEEGRVAEAVASPGPGMGTLLEAG